MNKGILAGSLVTGVILGGTLLSGTALAYRGDPSVQGPNYSQERHAAMEQAFESRNYQAWKEARGDRRGRVDAVVNEQNFARFVEAHEFAEEGNLDEARKIREELGLGLRDGDGQRAYHRQGSGRWGGADNR